MNPHPCALCMVARLVAASDHVILGTGSANVIRLIHGCLPDEATPSKGEVSVSSWPEGTVISLIMIYELWVLRMYPWDKGGTPSCLFFHWDEESNCFSF